MADKTHHFGGGFLGNFVFSFVNIVLWKGWSSRVQSVDLLIFWGENCPRIVFVGLLLRFGLFVIVNHVYYPIKFRDVRNHLNWELSGILVHVLDDLILVYHNGIEYILQILFLMVEVAHREPETLRLQYVSTITPDLGEALFLWHSGALHWKFWQLHRSGIQRKGIEKLGHPVLVIQVHLLVL